MKTYKIIAANKTAMSKGETPTEAFAKRYPEYSLTAVKKGTKGANVRIILCDGERKSENFYIARKTTAKSKSVVKPKTVAKPKTVVKAKPVAKPKPVVKAKPVAKAKSVEETRLNLPMRCICMLWDNKDGIRAVVVGTESTFEVVCSAVLAATSWDMLERTLPKDCELINTEFDYAIARHWDLEVRGLRYANVKKSVGKTKPTSKLRCLFQMYNDDNGVIVVVVGPASSREKVMKIYSKAETSPGAVWENFVETVPKGCAIISMAWDSELAVPW